MMGRESLTGMGIMAVWASARGVQRRASECSRSAHCPVLPYLNMFFKPYDDRLSSCQDRANCHFGDGNKATYPCAAGLGCDHHQQLEGEMFFLSANFRILAERLEEVQANCQKYCAGNCPNRSAGKMFSSFATNLIPLNCSTLVEEEELAQDTCTAANLVS